MRAYERFLRYAAMYTTSDETSTTVPTTRRQKDLGRLLVQELQDMGFVDARMDDKGYVYASLPATPGCEGAPALGWVAHMDTAPAFCGEGVTPLVHQHYDGGDVPLPKEGRVLRVADFPFLKKMAGQTLITADGSTLLGADDKAGIAEILTACERILAEGRPHGRLCVGFTPDEEVGRGAAHFDVASFGADYAYTMDGGAVGGVEYENFNAAEARLTVTGVSVHPGSAKGVMVNALLVLGRADALLPKGQTPADTEGYEGFYHLESIHGDNARAEAVYIVRDHDAAQFEARKKTLEQVADTLRAQYPTAQVELLIHDQYRNMAEKIKPCMHLIETARQATLDAGVQPYTEPVRGGTDGATLSYMGLPCPNLGTGGHNFHGPYECITAEDMDTAVDIILHIVARYAAV